MDGFDFSMTSPECESGKWVCDSGEWVCESGEWVWLCCTFCRFHV